MADQLCTVAQVKARIEVTDATDDTLISELIDQVSDYVQDVTGRKLVAEPAATYYVDTSAGSVIRVNRGIRAVTSLSLATADSPDDGSGTYTAVAAADILLRPESIDRKPGWPATSILIRGNAPRMRGVLNGAKIVGDFGFLVTPPTIVAVVIDAVVTAFTDPRAGASGVIGADGTSAFPWAGYFGAGTPQLGTLMRYRAGYGQGIG